MSTAHPDVPASLRPSALATGHTAIVGLQWGDEGKGKVVDLLTPEFDTVVRYNGGANAGHSVQVGDTRYALHLIPSGILYPDKLNVLGNGVVVDPDKLVSEMRGLRERGVAIGDNLRVSDRAHVVMPYHKVQDALQEAAITLPDRDDRAAEAIGTTGRGIGPCYADKALRSTAIRMGDLTDAPRLRDRLERIVPIKNATLAALSQYVGQPFEPFDADALVDALEPAVRELTPHVTDTATLLHAQLDAGRRLLFEGANATLLDIDHGTFPFVTSSNCSSLGLHTGTAVPGHHLSDVLGVVKAYQTRVGGGPMPTELLGEPDDGADGTTAHRIREVGREYGTTTGRPRRVGWIDLVALRYAARVSGATELAIMLLDVLSGLPELKLATAYDINGTTTDRFPADAADLARAKPIYRSLPGFDEPIDDVTGLEDLPAAARGYLDAIERAVGVPIRLISVGPRRDQVIHTG
ncbi:MAG: adenylosuccinate synthase [Planctomycetota bacterium]